MNEWHFNKFPYKDVNKGKKAMIMGNGPSLKDVITKYKKGNFEIIEDSFFVNFSPLNDTFFEIKPRHYFISDFGWCMDFPGSVEKVRTVYEKLQNRVDWPLKIYVNIGLLKHCRQVVAYSRITNPYIEFVFLNRKYCNGLCGSLRNFLYNKGLFMPTEATVINTAIYVALLEGFSEIELYGVEHNMFLDLRVNDDNQLCMFQHNFYEEEPVLTPVMLDGEEGAPSKIANYMHFIQSMFSSHDLLRSFADYKGAHIVNCTKGSMIDSYDRKNTDYE